MNSRGPTAGAASRSGEGSEVRTQPSDRIRVVADPRTNSLVIQCPADQVDELPNLLAVT